MKDYVIVHIYIDKDRNMIFLPYKICRFGYAVAVGPYRKFNRDKWETVSEEAIKLLEEVSKQPKTELTESRIMKEICKNKGFKQFSKKHICIEIAYEISSKRVTVSNWPRLSDGSYGSEKDSVSEKYCVEYTSTDDAAAVQKNFLKAYLDAESYLREIGGEL